MRVRVSRGQRCTLRALIFAGSMGFEHLRNRYWRSLIGLSSINTCVLRSLDRQSFRGLKLIAQEDQRVFGAGCHWSRKESLGVQTEKKKTPAERTLF